MAQTPAPAAAPPPPPSAAATPQALPDWDSLEPMPDTPPAPGTATATPPPITLPDSRLVDLNTRAQLLAPPPSTEGLPPLPAGPGHDGLIMGGVRLGTEIGGTLLANRFLGPIKGATFLTNTLRSAAATGLGSGAGTALHEGVVEPLYQQQGPPSVDQLLRDAGSSAAWSAAGELGAGMVSRAWTGTKNLIANRWLGERARAPLAGSMTPEGREAAEVLDGAVTPGQTMGEDATGVHTIENVFSGSIFGRRPYTRVIQEQARRLRQRATQIIDSFGAHRAPEEAGQVITGALGRQADAVAARSAAHTEAGAAMMGRAQSRRQQLRAAMGPRRTPEEAGRIWQDLQTARYTAEKEAADVLYGEVDRLSELATTFDARVDLSGMLDEVAAIEREMPEMARVLSGKGGALPGVVKRTGEEVIPSNNPEALAAMESLFSTKAGTGLQTPEGQALQLALQRAGITPEKVQARKLSFVEAHRVRSELGKLVQEASDRGNGTLKYTSSRFFSAIDDAMTDAARQAEVAGVPGLREAYDEASGAWKHLRQTYDEGILADVAQKDPYLVVDRLTRAKSVADIEQARAAIGDEGWQAIQSAHLDQLLRDANGWASAKTLRSRLHKLTPETVQAIYGPHARPLQTLVRELDAAEGLTALGTQHALTAEQLRRDLPEAYQAIRSLIRPKRVADIETMRTLVGPEDWRAVQGAFAEDLLKDGDGLKSGAKLLKDLAEYTPETIAAVFPKGEANGIYQLARVMKQVQEKTPGALKMWVQLAQGAAAGAIATGNLTTKALGILITPPILARIAMSPTARQWFTTGLRASTNTGAAAYTRSTAYLISWLAKEGLIPGMGTASGASGGPGSVGMADPDTLFGAPARAQGPGPRAGGPPSADLPR